MVSLLRGIGLKSAISALGIQQDIENKTLFKSNIDGHYISLSENIPDRKSLFVIINIRPKKFTAIDSGVNFVRAIS